MVERLDPLAERPGRCPGPRRIWKEKKEGGA